MSTSLSFIWSCCLHHIRTVTTTGLMYGGMHRWRTVSVLFALSFVVPGPGTVRGQDDTRRHSGQPLIETMDLLDNSFPSTGSGLSVETIISHVRGAITSRSGVELSGCFVVDGRDHNSLNVPISPGIFGCFTCSTMTLSGIARIGGNGIEPVKKKDFSSVIGGIVCYEHAKADSSFASPEAFLGLTAGSLDRYKVAASEFIPPFEGIVYVTEDVGPFHLRNSKGILIVHNERSDARLNIVFGNFEGLIICDIIEAISGRPEILGAVVTLSPVTGSRFGSGCAEVHFSLQALNNLGRYYVKK